MPPSEAQQEAAARLLERAVGAGRLTLDEFSHRVGVVWAATRAGDVEDAVTGLANAPPVDARTVSTIVAFIGDQVRGGRWRLPALVRLLGVLGDIHLDLRSTVCTEETVEIRAWAFAGDIDLLVPDGVDVELTGFDILGDRELRLAPTPRLRSAPKIRLRAYTLLGDVSVHSTSAGKGLPGWRRWLLGHRSPSVPTPSLAPPDRDDATR